MTAPRIISAETMANIIAFYVVYKRDYAAAAEALRWYAKTGGKTNG
jgi:hypothetical protein